MYIYYVLRYDAQCNHLYACYIGQTVGVLRSKCTGDVRNKLYKALECSRHDIQYTHVHTYCDLPSKSAELFKEVKGLCVVGNEDNLVVSSCTSHRQNAVQHQHLAWRSVYYII